MLGRNLIFLVIFLDDYLCDAYSGTYFNSNVYSERLVEVEGQMLALCDFILEEENKLHDGVDVHNFSSIQTYLSDTKHIHATLTRDAASVTQHPVSLYKLRRRIGSQWPPVLDIISETELMKTIPSLTATLAKYRNIIEHEANPSSAVGDLLRLQRFYSLRTHHLAEGRVLGEVSAPLDDEEIFEIGQALVEAEDNRRAVEWLEVGVALCNHSEHTERKTHFTNVIASSYMRMNRYEEAKTLYEKLIENAPNNRAAISSLKLLNSKLDQPPQETSGRHEASPTDEDEAVESWQHHCDGHYSIRNNAESDSTLLCYNKYLNISDEFIHVEEVMLKPRLVLIHDVFTHRETDLIIREASSHMKQYMSVFEDQYWKAEGQTALHLDNDWTDGLLSRLRNITVQRNNITDERIMAWIEVSNMGSGTQGKNIVVENTNNIEDHGRIVHYMLFLNDVRGGGAIVFPKLNLRITPVRGAALVWQYSSIEDESRQLLDYHVKCPVLLGSQWLGKAVVDYTGWLDRVRL